MSTIDTSSPTWRAVKAWAEERIEVHRSRLETHGLPLAETEHARGAISDLRLLVELPEPSKFQMPFQSAETVD